MRIKLYSLVLLTILLSGGGIAAASQMAEAPIAAASEQADAPITPTTVFIPAPDVAAAEAAIAESIGQHLAAVEEEKQREAAATRAVPEYRNTKPVEVETTTDRWDRLAQCETGGNWAANTGNGFGGGLQFMHQRSYSTWLSYGGGEFAPHPWEASREQQIVIAERVLAGSGWKAWPGCSRKFGWL